MQSTVTLKIKLDVRKDDALALDLTRAAYAQALNETSGVAFAQSVSHPFALHHLTYLTIRELTALPVNLLCELTALHLPD
jgi:predicted transposase